MLSYRSVGTGRCSGGVIADVINCGPGCTRWAPWPCQGNKHKWHTMLARYNNGDNKDNWSIEKLWKIISEYRG